jgi:hypothetical protein
MKPWPAKLEARPELLAVARDNLARWLADRSSPALIEWRDGLDQSVPAHVTGAAVTVVDLAIGATKGSGR